jgi:hypothetical protein
VSYDIHLTVDAGGPDKVRVYHEKWGTSFNYTYNIRPMLVLAGCTFQSIDGKSAAEAATMLERALNVMRNNPDDFRKLNPANGWGDYDNFRVALEELLSWMLRYPKATVEVG